MGAQLEGGALGGFALAHIFAGAAHGDLVESTCASRGGMMSTGVDRTFDTGVTINVVFHIGFPPLFYGWVRP